MQSGFLGMVTKKKNIVSFYLYVVCQLAYAGRQKAKKFGFISNVPLNLYFLLEWLLK